MSSMIGKVSGVDWEKAPKDATHIGIYTKSTNLFYKEDNGRWYYLSASREWKWSDDKYRSEYAMVPKEEDLGMGIKKQVSKVEDLESGMFVKFRDAGVGKAVVVVPSAISTTTSFTFFKNGGLNKCMASHYNGLSYEPNKEYDIVAWSYTYEGEYTPVVREPELTPKQLKVKELQDTIATASKQLQELEEPDK